MVDIPTRFGSIASRIAANAALSPEQLMLERQRQILAELPAGSQFPTKGYTGPAATFDQVMARQKAARPSQRMSNSVRAKGMMPTAPNAFIPSAPMAQMAESVRAKGMMPTAPTPAGGPTAGLADIFKQPITSPSGRGIMAAALAGLQAGGYQDRPMTIGQGIAQMGAAGMQAFDAETAAEAARKAQQQQLEFAASQAEFDAEQAEFERQYKTADLEIKGRAKPIKPVMKMLPVEGGTQLTMIDPNTGEILGSIGDIKPASGMRVSVDADGNVTFTQGVAEIEKGTKKSLETDILSLTNQISMLNQARLSYDPSLLTYGANLETLLGTTLSKINPDLLSREQKDKAAAVIEFRRGVQQSFSGLLKELSGAAVSKFELASAENYSINPKDSPLEFEPKLRDQIGFAKAALYRAQQVLGGEPITNDLSEKYPISISGKDSGGKMQKLYMHEFVEKYMRMNDVDQADAIEAYAEMAKGSGQ